MNPDNTNFELGIEEKLFLATKQIARSFSEEELLNLTVNTFRELVPYAALYRPADEKFRLFSYQENDVDYSTYLIDSVDITTQEVESYLLVNSPAVITNIVQPDINIHPELLGIPKKLGCVSAAYFPIMIKGGLAGFIFIGFKEIITPKRNEFDPFSTFLDIVNITLEKLIDLNYSKNRLNELETLNRFSNAISQKSDLDSLYKVIHKEITKLIGEVQFYIAIYEPSSNNILIPYLYENGEVVQIDPFPLGEGLTSTVIKTKKSLLLVENTKERAEALGAKVDGEIAKSWLGVPLTIAGEVMGVVTLQDSQNENRFTEDDLELIELLSNQISNSIHSTKLLQETSKKAIQLQTASEIARDTSGTLELDELLRKAVNLILNRFNYYHASVFLIEAGGEFAVVRESTGDAGKKMKRDKHSLRVGSQSVVGYVTEHLEPFVNNDVRKVETHKFNPLLPDTRAELGIPLAVGDRVLGAIDVQSTEPYAFQQDDIEVLQILADQLAVAVANAELFSETQEHLAQHRLIHHVTTAAASSSNLFESLTGAVEGLRITMGDRVSILLYSPLDNKLRVEASSGYDKEVYGLQIDIGQGITGWAASRKEPLMVNDVANDPRYLSGSENVQSELAFPLMYRGELLGVLNVESNELNYFKEHDQDILGILAGSLSAIIINTRLSDRQRQLFEATNNIRRSVNIETIMQTTVDELSKALQTRKTSIQVGGSQVSPVQEEMPVSNGNSEDIIEEDEI